MTFCLVTNKEASSNDLTAPLIDTMSSLFNNELLVDWTVMFCDDEVGCKNGVMVSCSGALALVSGD